MNTYMIIPVYDMVILPDVDYHVGTSDLSEEEKSRIKIDGNKALIVPLKEPTERTAITADSLYPMGVLADIVEISAGLSHTIGVTSDGKILVVGDNSWGQCDIAG